MPVQFFHRFTWGVKAWHPAQRHISTLPELSEWTLQFGTVKLIHFSTLPSSFSWLWEMTTWTKLDIIQKQISQIRFCKKILIIESPGLRTATIKRDILIKRLSNGIFVKSNTKRFTELTNCNLSQRLVELTLLFSVMLKSTSFPSTALNCSSNDGIYFFCSHPSFTAAYSLKSEKGWPVDFAKLWNLEPDSVTTMCPKEQQTSDNLIVKDNYFIVEIFDKFSFSGIFRGCLSHLRSRATVSLFHKFDVTYSRRWRK